MNILFKKGSKTILSTLLALAMVFSVPVVSLAQDDAPKDWCNDMAGVQLDIPGGYHRNEDGSCVAINLDGMPTQQITTVCPTGQTLVDNTNCMPDVCPNLPGAQAKMPNNYYEGDMGECFLNLDIRFNTQDGTKLSTPGKSGKYVYDACPNVWGIQGGVPAGYTKDLLTNRCTKKPVVDMCKNLKGNQTTIPKNHTQTEDGNCYNKSSDQKPVVKAYDWCTNIPETQTSLPIGMMRPKEGTECLPIVTPVVVDRCSNIENNQTTIPDGYYQRDGSTECFKK